MKKIRIFKTFFDEEQNKYVKQTLRQVSLGASFKGFGKMGRVIKHEFSTLADILEPESTGWEFLN